MAATKIYRTPNKYIVPGFIDELYATLGHIKLLDVLDMAYKLRLRGQRFNCKDGNLELTLEDICCLEGCDSYADSTGLYWFYGGPEMDDPNKGAFTLVCGTMLDWIIDTILFRISREGWEVSKKLGIPL